MRQSRKGKRSKAKGRELRLKKQIWFQVFPLSLNLEPRCLLPDINICAKNACLRACLSAVQAAQAGADRQRTGRQKFYN